ncbi:MAG: metalloregulator ArsR/SmtB family transcription factor [Caldilineaceae bacterium]|nr:metalloregulator ArsR/SmtB family transcription factor [Caldilineaceae bacterium]
MDNLLSTLKLLADNTRLNMLGLLAQTPRTGDELAALLDIKPSTVSHHLTRMQKAGLVSATAEQYYHTYAVEPQALRAISAQLTTTHLAERAQESGIVNADAYRQQVLARWLENDRLHGLPTQIKQRQVVLEWLAAKFEPDLRYGPRQRDDVLNRWCSWRDPRAIDITAVERVLIEAKLLARTRDGRWGWRTDSPLVQAVKSEGGAFDPNVLPEADTANLHVPFVISPLMALVRLAIRIQPNQPLTAAEIDEMIQANSKEPGQDVRQLHTHMLAEGLLHTSPQGLFIRPTLASDHPAMQKLRAEAIAFNQ